MTATLTTPISRAPGRTRVRALSAAGAVLAGLVLAVLWSPRLVDTLGVDTTTSVIGHDARRAAIGSLLAGVVFAFVSGVAGTFTACNVAVFGALPALVAERSSRAARLRAAVVPVAWLSVGLLGVAAGYGVLAVLLGRRLPQLSAGTLDGHLPTRLLQSVVVFGVVGLAFAYLGLAALGALPDPFARRPRARLITLGALVGGFLVGRPYPLFHKLLDYAVATHDPLYGALTLCLQALGNVLVIALLAAVFALAAGPATARWLARPGRVALISGVALLALGTFMVVYWDVRLPAIFGYGWFPTAPWNG
jgi:cytochrome c biogenesis protein CcdA